MNTTSDPCQRRSPHPVDVDVDVHNGTLSAVTPPTSLLPSSAPAHPFSELFPPPYRVLALLALGVLGWAFVVHLLHRLGIDTDEILSGGNGAVDDVKKDAACGVDSGGGSSSSSSSSSGSGSVSGSGSSSDLPVHVGVGVHAHARSSSSSARRRWYKATSSPRRIARPALPSLGIGVVLAVWTFTQWLFLRAYVDRRGGDPSGRHSQALQAIAITAVFAALVWPGNILWRSKRRQFGRALVPLFNPLVLLTRAPSFPSILLADVLTSFAKVFGDVWLTACFLLPRREHHTWWNGRGSWAVPALVSLPFAIRLVQCLAEYAYTSAQPPIESDAASMDSTRKVPLPAKSKRPLANALKYASAFPVIWISASQPERAGGVPDAHEVLLHRAWLLSITVNSLFSFWWDVTNDWGLEALKVSTWAGILGVGVRGGLVAKTSAPLSSSSIIAAPPAAPAQSLHRRGLSVWPAPRGAEERYTDAAGGRLSPPLSQSLPHSASSASSSASAASDDDDDDDDDLADVETLVERLHPNSNTNLHGHASSSSGAHARSLSARVLRAGAGAGAGAHAPLPSHYHPHKYSPLPDSAAAASPWSPPPPTPTPPPMLLPAWVYHAAIALDLLLRCTWSLKLSPHLAQLVALESGVFLLELGEILRRTGWIVLRVEWEVVKRRRARDVELREGRERERERRRRQRGGQLGGGGGGDADAEGARAVYGGRERYGSVTRREREREHVLTHAASGSTLVG